MSEGLETKCLKYQWVVSGMTFRGPSVDMAIISVISFFVKIQDCNSVFSSLLLSHLDFIAATDRLFTKKTELPTVSKNCK